VHRELLSFPTRRSSDLTIVGALGYFILPFDLIPDIAVGVGYVDDLGVLTAALISVAMYIDNDIKNQAKSKLADWFGDDADTSGRSEEHTSELQSRENLV